MQLLFSGELNEIYSGDNLGDPGIYVECMEITDTTKTNIYFAITDNELQKHNDEKQAIEDFGDAVYDAFDDLSNSMQEYDFSNNGDWVPKDWLDEDGNVVY